MSAIDTTVRIHTPCTKCDEDRWVHKDGKTYRCDCNEDRFHVRRINLEELGKILKEANFKKKEDNDE